MKPRFDEKNMCFWVHDDEATQAQPDDTELEEDGELKAVELKLPAKYEVCDRCSGHGKHDHPAFANGITGEQFAEDPDFEEAYFAGVYDVRCTECNGERVVPVPADHLNSLEAQRANKLYEEWFREERDYRKLCEMERRMGC